MTCRTCNFSKPNLKDLYQVSYDDDGSKNTLAGKLEAITGCIINMEDSSSKAICFQCKLILEMSFEFQKMSQNNEHFYSQQKPAGSVDVEMFEEEIFEEDFLEDQKFIEKEINPKKEVKQTTKCDDCSKNFHTKIALDIHKKLMHKKTMSSPPKHEATSPQSKYIKTEIPESKMTRNVINPFCTICQKHFHTEKAFLLHIKIKHKGVKD